MARFVTSMLLWIICSNGRVQCERALPAFLPYLYFVTFILRRSHASRRADVSPYCLAEFISWPMKCVNWQFAGRSRKRLNVFASARASSYISSCKSAAKLMGSENSRTDASVSRFYDDENVVVTISRWRVLFSGTTYRST